MSLTLKTGDLAFYDSLTAGLVPCRVLEIKLGEFNMPYAKIQYTATRDWAKRGHVETWGTRRVVPRAAVRRFRGQFFPRIRPYTVEVDQ